MPKSETEARQALERALRSRLGGILRGCTTEIANELFEDSGYSALVAERDQLAEKVKTLRDAVSAFVEGMEICHMCGSLLAVEDAGPSHCEDCSGDCDDHEGPDCAIMHDLYSAMKRAALASAKPEEPA